MENTSIQQENVLTKRERREVLQQRAVVLNRTKLDCRIKVLPEPYPTGTHETLYAIPSDIEEKYEVGFQPPAPLKDNNTNVRFYYANSTSRYSTVLTPLQKIGMKETLGPHWTFCWGRYETLAGSPVQRGLLSKGAGSRKSFSATQLAAGQSTLNNGDENNEKESMNVPLVVPRPWQKLHHFMGMYIIGRKDRLGSTSLQAKRQFGGEFLPFIPETFHLPTRSTAFQARYEQALTQCRLLRSYSTAPTPLQRTNSTRRASALAPFNVSQVPGIYSAMSNSELCLSSVCEVPFSELVGRQLQDIAPNSSAREVLLQLCSQSSASEMSMCPLGVSRCIAFLGPANPLWIAKPASSSCGRGIRVVSRLSECKHFLDGHSSSTSSIKSTDPATESTSITENGSGSSKTSARYFKSVICRYVSNPLLIAGKKFDLRIYVLVTCADPLLVYIYNEGLVRFCTEQYEIPSTESQRRCRFANLTNFSVNKKNTELFSNLTEEDIPFDEIKTNGSRDEDPDDDNASVNECAEVGGEIDMDEDEVEDNDEIPDEDVDAMYSSTASDKEKYGPIAREGGSGNQQRIDWNRMCQISKWPLSLFKRYLTEVLGVEPKPIFACIDDLICRTLLVAVPNLISVNRHRGVHRFQTSELLGFDVLLDAGLNPWLMEVNVGPSLSASSKLDQKIKYPLLRDTLNMAGIEPVDGKKALTGDATSFYHPPSRFNYAGPASQKKSQDSSQQPNGLNVHDIGRGLSTRIPAVIPPSIQISSDSPLFQNQASKEENMLKRKKEKGSFKQKFSTSLRSEKFCNEPNQKVHCNSSVADNVYAGTILEFIPKLFLPSDIAMLRRIDAEQMRMGGYRRIFPNPNTISQYAPYLSSSFKGLAVLLRFMQLPECLALHILGSRNPAYLPLLRSSFHESKPSPPHILSLLSSIRQREAGAVNRVLKDVDIEYPSNQREKSSTDIDKSVKGRRSSFSEKHSVRRNSHPYKPTEIPQVRSLLAAINIAEKINPQIPHDTNKHRLGRSRSNISSKQVIVDGLCAPGNPLLKEEQRVFSESAFSPQIANERPRTSSECGIQDRQYDQNPSQAILLRRPSAVLASTATFGGSGQLGLSNLSSCISISSASTAAVSKSPLPMSLSYDQQLAFHHSNLIRIPQNDGVEKPVLPSIR